MHIIDQMTKKPDFLFWVRKLAMAVRADCLGIEFVHPLGEPAVEAVK